MSEPIINTTSGEPLRSRQSSSYSPALLAVQDVDISKNESCSSESHSNLEKQPDSHNFAFPPGKDVAVTDPERWGDKEPFVVYTLRTRKPDVGGYWQVKRRFQEFADLHAALSEHHDQLTIVPPLPSKNNFEFKDKFHPAFTERRRKALERFLSRLLGHPKLSKHDLLAKFLHEQNFVYKNHNSSSTSVVMASTASGLTSIVEKFGDALSGLSIFARTNQTEERFEEMKRLCAKLELHYSKLEDIFVHLYKAHRTMEEAMTCAGKEAMQVQMALMQLKDGLDMESEGTIQETLRKISVLYEDQADALHTFADSLKADITGPMHEYNKYCMSAKDSLKVREDKQYTAEELSHYLAKSRYQLNELRGGQTSADDPGADHSLLAPFKSGARVVSGYFSGKFDSMKGVDVLTAKQQKLVNIERRIGELEQAVKAAKEGSEAANEDIGEEMKHFEQVLQDELKNDLLPALIQLFQEYTKKSAARWKAGLSDE